MEPKEPYHEFSLLDFQRRFPDEATCWEHVVRLRWPKGKACPACRRPMGFIQTRQVFQCNSCRKHVSVTAGTVFHRSHLPLQKWFWAIYLMAHTPKGISMRSLQKQLGIKSYRAAWLMGHKIRQAMIQREKLYRLKGRVQVDEISLGRQNWDHRRETREDRHTKFLMGIQEGVRHPYPRFVSFEQLDASFKENVLPLLEKRVAKGSHLKSDGAGVFGSAKKKGYKVKQIPMATQPEKAKKHLEGIHWFTSNFKRGLVSTYHGCAPKYRAAYLAEFAYRFNRRYWPYQAFDRLLTACLQGKHRTLNELKA